MNTTVGEALRSRVKNLEAMPAMPAVLGPLRGSAQSPLFDAEKQVLGFTHCNTGKMLADYWSLPGNVNVVIEFHHEPEHAPPPASLPALVNLADSLCGLRGMGYGYDEMCDCLGSFAEGCAADRRPRRRALHVGIGCGSRRNSAARRVRVSELSVCELSRGRCTLATAKALLQRPRGRFHAPTFRGFSRDLTSAR